MTRENIEKIAAGVSKKLGDSSAAGSATLKDKDAALDSVAALVCSFPNQPLLNRLAGEAALASGRIKSFECSVKRVLFPRYAADQSGERAPLDPYDIKVYRNKL